MAQVLPLENGAATPHPSLRDGLGLGATPALLAGAALLVASIILFVINTHHGISIEPDSTRYMSISPIAWDAPVYHWLVTGGLPIGIGVQTAAMGIALLTLLINVALIYGLILRGSDSWRLAGVGTALVALAPQFVGLSAAAMSEGPFLSFLLLSVWFTLDYVQSWRRGSLLLSAVMLGLASLTRFTAPPLGAAIVLLLLLDPRRPMKARLADCALVALVSGALFFAWIGWSQESEGRSIGRELAFNGNLGLAEWRANLEAFLAWVLPRGFGLPLRLVLLSLVVGYAGTTAWRQLGEWRGVRERAGHETGTGLALCVVLALFFLGYLGFVILSTTIEANLFLDGRYALPAYLLLIIVLAVQYARLVRPGLGRSRLQGALLVLAALVLVSHAGRTAIHSLQTWRDGSGFNAVQWRQSPTMAAVRRLPADAVIYANGADVAALLTGRAALMSPQMMDYRLGRPEPGNELPVQLARMRMQARTSPVYLVFYDNMNWRFYLAAEADLVRLLGLPAPTRFADGRIYRVAPTSSVNATQARP